MNYIDTDVLIHYLVKQDAALHLKAIELLDSLILNDQFNISWLSIQETGFVLAKLGQPRSVILAKLNYLMLNSPVHYGTREFKRAVDLTEVVGFKNFNDCLNIAIAEQHCTDFYTCNHKDFRNLTKHTKLNIHFFNDQ